MDPLILRKMLEKSLPTETDGEQLDPGETIRGTGALKAYSRVLNEWGSWTPAEEEAKSNGKDGRPAKSFRVKKAPSIVGRSSSYEILEKLGSGGMGDVYRAFQTSLKREVVIKQLKTDSKRDKNDAKAFIAEALASGFLDHPNIAPIYDLVETPQGEPAIAMKLIVGTCWRDLLHPWTPELEERAKDYDLERHVEILIAVCNAVAFAHSKGIIHRDIKPSNVMVGEFGEVYLMDWGMAVCHTLQQADGKPIERLRAPYKDTVTEPSGTPGYLAPEMAEARGRDLGPWTDVYLLGATMYELLTGRQPHRGKSILAIVTSASRSLPPKFPESVPAELQEICRRAMARDVTERFDSAEDFQAALREFLSHRESRRIETAADEARQRCWGDSLERRLKNERERVRAYGDLSEALAGYKQALVLWEKNESAAEKEKRTRMAFAKAALSTGDFSLAQAQLEGLEGRKAASLKKELAEALENRVKVARSHQRLKVGAASIAALLIIGLGVGFFLVSREKVRADDNAKAARDNARDAQSNLVLARSNAEEARDNERRAQSAALRAEEVSRQKSLALEQVQREKTRADENARKAQENFARAEAARKDAEENARRAERNAEEARAEKERALRAQKVAKAQRSRADMEEEAKSEALEQVQLLADIQLLRRYESRGKKLLASGKPDAKQMRAWLADARRLMGRRHQHGSNLLDVQLSASASQAGSGVARDLAKISRLMGEADRMRTRLENPTGLTSVSQLEKDLERKEREIARLRRRVKPASEYRFGTRDDREDYDTLVELTEGLDRLAGPEGVYTRIDDHLSANAIDSESARASHTMLWRKVVRRVSRSRRYKKLAVSPHADLYPLGPDPESKLEEFVHLPSHRGPLPERDDSRRLWVTEDTGLVFVLIPDGEFWMGGQADDAAKRNYAKTATPIEAPVHRADTPAFYISKFEMTQGQWRRIFGRNPSTHGPGPMASGRIATLAHPVESVSRKDCDSFEEHGLDLPSEVQWEYVSRAGTATPWFTGKDRSEVRHAGNVADASCQTGVRGGSAEQWKDGFAEHAPVGSFRANRFGLYDVIGNVEEWCRDAYRPYDGSTAPREDFVLRGGSYRDTADLARAASRRRLGAAGSDPTAGVRPVINVGDGTPAPDWDEARAAVARHPAYGRLKLREQPGLATLGPDPDSGLHEFLHLASHEGPVPGRDARGRIVTDEKTGIVFVLVPGGDFTMGAQRESAEEANHDRGAEPIEGPPHRVSLDPYLISKFELTQAQWMRLRESDPSRYGPRTSSRGRSHTVLHPVEQISWTDCEKLTEDGLEIPTEAQWEYAARGGRTTPWWCGTEIASCEKAGNVAEKARGRTLMQTSCESWNDGWKYHAPVGSFAPNAFGLHDVVGNVAEWCRDGFHGYAEPTAPGHGLRLAKQTDQRVCRGGSYADLAVGCRSAARQKCEKGFADASTGFRPVRTIQW